MYQKGQIPKIWRQALIEIIHGGKSEFLAQIEDQKAWLDWVIDKHNGPLQKDKDGLWSFKLTNWGLKSGAVSRQNPINVLSLGWGLQSWTIAAMAALGELPKPDICIFSDTSWERKKTSSFAAKWELWLYMHGVKCITVWDESAHGMIKDEWEGTFIPAYTITSEPRYGIDEEGNEYIAAYRQKVGQLRRQCTDRWKIVPMRRFISGAILSTHFAQIHKMYAFSEVDLDVDMLEGIVAFSEMRMYDIIADLEDKFGHNLKKTSGCVKQWLGISVDEVQRVKPSDVQWIDNHYPLLEMGMARADCITWLNQHDLPIPPKSSCVFCPYRSKRSWQELKREGGEDWEIALFVDGEIRNQRPPYPLFVHPSGKPLDEAVVIEEDFGMNQLNMFIDIDDRNAECDSGHCFL